MEEKFISSEKLFETSHFSLACYLYYLGFRLEGISGEDKKIFYFRRDVGLDDAIQKFWRKEALVEPEAFLLVVKTLKSRLYDFDRKL